jgi:PIN domain
MANRYVLIDHENVQPKDLALLAGQPLKVIVFLGANQTKVSAELAMALQARGQDGEYVRIDGSGRNALDMHIAHYLGELAAKEPAAQFYVISKDHDYDSLLRHLKGKGVSAQRAENLAPLLAPADANLQRVIAHLRRMKQARPRRIKTLASTISSLFAKELSEAQVQALIAALERRREIAVQETKVSYAR